MYTVFQPDLNRLARRVVRNHRRFRSREWTEAEVRSHQTSELRETLRYVKANSPFYRCHLAALDAAVIDGLTLDDVQALPFTTKDDLRRHRFEILSGPVSNTCVFYETTGTTGPSTPCPRDSVESIHSNTAVTLCYETILCTGDRRHIVGVAGPTELHSFGDTLGDVCRNLRLPHVKLWPPSPLVGWDKALEVMRETGVTVLMCTPGMALSLAKHALAQALSPSRDFAVEILMVTGELASPAMLRNIEQLWDARAYNFLYGSQEAFVLAAATARGCLHTFPLNNLYEVIKPQTTETAAPRADGTVEGELVVTTLFRGSKPLVRYRTGDLVRLRLADPVADMPSPTVEVLGRINDVLRLGGRPVSGVDLEQLILSCVGDCLGYQITLSGQNGDERVAVELELAERAHPANDLDGIVSALERRFGVVASVRRCSLGAIGGTGAMVSWKAARIVDVRTQTSDPEKAAALRIARQRDKRSHDDPLVTGQLERCWALHEWLEGRPLVRVLTLGPAETSSYAAARHLTATLARSGVASKLRIDGHDDFDRAERMLKEGDGELLLLPNAYEGITRAYWDNELEFLLAFEHATPSYVLAVRDGRVPEVATLRIASCPPVAHLAARLGANLIDGRAIEDVRTASTHAAARLVATGAADLAVTNEPSARRHALAVLAATPGVPMIWSLFRRRGQ